MAENDIVLITGANTGLGLETVKALCQSPIAYNVLVGCRSVKKGEDAVANVREEFPETKTSLSIVQVDVSSDESIEKAVKTIQEKYGKLDVLINNAGAQFDRDIQSGRLSIREGFNQSWDTNVTGTQVLTTLAMPLLFKSPNPRLLFITSGTTSLGETVNAESEIVRRLNTGPPPGWPKEKALNPTASYRSAKTGLNMLMREWSRVLENDPVKVFAISPGFLATGWGGFGAEQMKKMGAIDPSIGAHFIKDVVEGKRDEDRGMVMRKDAIQPF